MTGPTRLIHDLAGKPMPEGAVVELFKEQPGQCCMCGETEQVTADANRALGNNFTDRSMFTAPTSRVCVGCVWCASGQPPATLRMWSVVAAPGHELPASAEKAWLRDTPGLFLTSRQNTTPIIDTLTHPPDGEWVVTVAVSGQKHVVPYAVTNTGRGRWTVRMETVNVSGDPAAFDKVIKHAKALRQQGNPPGNVLDLSPSMAVKTMADLDYWTEHATPIKKWRNSPLLDLALFLLTKAQLEKGQKNDQPNIARTTVRSDSEVVEQSSQLGLF